MTFEVKQHKNLHYIIRYPDGFDKNSKYPTILFLHGHGSRGNDISILENGPFLQRLPADSPFIAIVPQCFADTWFEILEQLTEFTAEIRKTEYIDTNRFYLMGNSMGGYATWQLGMSKPEWFTAMIPICGGGLYWNAKRLMNVPIWAFHGIQDDVVLVEESIKMVNSVNKNGGNAKLTLYEHAKHDSWSDTFSNPEIYQWLLRQMN